LNFGVWREERSRIGSRDNGLVCGADNQRKGIGLGVNRELWQGGG